MTRKTFAQYYMTPALLAFPNMRFISAVGALALELHSFGFGLTRLETKKCQRLSEFIKKKKLSFIATLSLNCHFLLPPFIFTHVYSFYLHFVFALCNFNFTLIFCCFWAVLSCFLFYFTLWKSTQDTQTVNKSFSY